MTTFTAVLVSSVITAKDSHTPAWLDAPVEFKTDEDGWIAAGVLAATYSNTQPVTENPSTVAAVRMPGYADDFYNRIIIEPAVLDVGSVTSSQLRTLSVFNGYFVSKTLGALVLTNGTGISLSGPSIPATWAPLQVRTYDVTLSPNGPPNIAAQLFFNWDGGSADDSTVYINGVRIVVMPYQASVPWTETLEWKTQVLTANDGTEQRVRLRSAARQAFTGTYPIPNSQIARAVNLVYGWIGRRWAVPVWSEAQQLTGLAAGQTVVTLNVTDYDYRVGELIGFWNSPTKNEAIEVAAIGSGTITLLTPLSQAYANAHVYPVRVGKVADGSIERSTNGFNSEIAVTFDILQNIELVPASPPQYLGQDLYTDASLFDGDKLSEKFETRIDEIDYGNLTSEFAPWLYAKTTRPYRVIKDDPADIRAFKLFLFRRCGRLRPFWYPTFEMNLRMSVTTGAVTNTIRIYADDYQFVGSAHNHIAIRFTSGTWATRAVVALASVGGDQLDVSFDGAALGVDASTISFVSFLALKRLNTDKVTLEYATGGVMTSVFPVTEIAP